MSCGDRRAMILNICLNIDMTMQMHQIHQMLGLIVEDRDAVRFKCHDLR